MHYMHYKDYIHHGLAAEKTPPPLPQGGEPSGWVGGVWGSLLIYIYGENNGKSIYKWMIWGYHYFRKPPYIEEFLGPQEWSVAQPELISKGLDV